MKSKVIILWLISLFGWNAVFGAFGGLLLCIHEGDVHLEAADSVDEACCAQELADSISDCSFEAVDTCIDVELSDGFLMVPRFDSMRTSLKYAPQPQVLIEAPDPVYALWEVSRYVAPEVPQRIDTSVLVVQTRCLRV